MLNMGRRAGESYPTGHAWLLRGARLWPGGPSEGGREWGEPGEWWWNKLYPLRTILLDLPVSGLSLSTPIQHWGFDKQSRARGRKGRAIPPNAGCAVLERRTYVGRPARSSRPLSAGEAAVQTDVRRPPPCSPLVGLSLLFLRIMQLPPITGVTLSSPGCRRPTRSYWSCACLAWWGRGKRN